jgi:benzoyl-CoA reductase/2-hydroxyglutaryl-CoA dehydratase subunit BcrC/BadD/HgdB
MDIEDGIQMISQIYEKQREDRHFTLYVSQYPHFTEENFITFEEFYKPHKQADEVVETKSSQEILADVRELLNSNNWM